MDTLLRTLVLLTLGGTGLALALLAVKYVLYRKLPSTFYYYAWLVVLLRFLLPIPGLVPMEKPQPGAIPPTVQAAPQTAVSPVIPENSAGEIQKQDSQQEAAPEFNEESPAETMAAAPVGNAPAAERQEREKDSRLPVSLSSPTLWMSIWAAGTVISLLWYVFSYNLFASEIRRHIRYPMPWDEWVLEGMRGRKPALWRCDGIYSPMLLGLFHPMIILPEGEFEEQTIRNILRHELMHYQRWDVLYKWFSVVVFSTQWFNPIAYVMRRELNRACELSCDEMIIRRMNRQEKQSYGDTLLNLAASRTLPANLTATTFSTEKRNLKERLVQIMKYKISTGTILIALLIIAALTACGAALGPRVATTVKEIRTAPRNLDSRTPLCDEPLSEWVDRALVYEISSDTLVYACEADTRMEPGCMTSLAVAMTVLEHCDPEETATVSDNDFYELPRYATNIRLKSGETVTVGDLIYALLLNNASDAAVTLAEHTAGSVEAFMPMMSRYLERLGCKDTCLTDVLGVAEGQYTTARDMARLTRKAMENEFFSQVWACRSYWLPATNQSRERWIYNGNPLFQGTYNYEDTRGITAGLAAGTQVDAPCTMVFTMRTTDAEPMELLFAVQLRQPEPGEEGYRMEGFRQTLPEELSRRFRMSRDPSGGLSVEAVPLEQSSLTLSDPLAGYDRSKVHFVKSVDQLLNNIQPGAILYLEEGEYNLRTADNYGKQSHYSPYYRWEEVTDGFQLVIQDVEDLTILGASPVTTQLVTEPRYASVLRFSGCSALEISNLTMGHTQQAGYCSGGVVALERCENVMIRNTGLFGCGTIGVEGWYCSDITVQSSDIYECSDSGVSFSMCQNIRVEENTFRDIGRSLNNSVFGQMFSLVSCRNACIEENTVTDSQCSELLYASSTTELSLLSNRFESGHYLSAFRVEGAPAVVEGCGFGSGFQTDSWFHSGSSRAVDFDGNSLTEDRLVNMEYRSGLTAPLREEIGQTYREITVTSVDQLLAAIGSNRTIFVDAPELKLSDAANYGGTGSDFYAWQMSYDGPELMISGVENLTIRSVSGKPEDCRILAEPRYANVLTFRNCRNVTISGITAGHTEAPGSCTGGVLNFSGCWNPTVENCSLFGCGTWGVEARYCTELTVRGCDIYDCSYGGINLAFVTGGVIENSLLRELEGMGIYGSDCAGIAITGCDFQNNQGSDVTLLNCTDFTRDGQTVFNLNQSA